MAAGSEVSPGCGWVVKLPMGWSDPAESAKHAGFAGAAPWERAGRRKEVVGSNPNALLCPSAGSPGATEAGGPRAGLWGSVDGRRRFPCPFSRPFPCLCWPTRDVPHLLLLHLCPLVPRAGPDAAVAKTLPSPGCFWRIPQGTVRREGGDHHPSS